MQKKMLFFLIIALCFFKYSYSQNPLFEIKGGLNFATISNYSYKYDPNIIHPNDLYSLGYYTGALYEFNIRKNIYFNTGLEISLKKFKDQIEYDYLYHYYSGMLQYYKHRKVDVTSTFYGVDIPLMFKYRFSEKFNLSVGILPNYFSANAKGKVIETINSIPAGYEEYDIDEHISAINQFGIDWKFSAEYLINRKWGIEAAFQKGLGYIFKEKYEGYVFEDFYADEYKKGRLTAYSIGIVYHIK